MQGLKGVTVADATYLQVSVDTLSFESLYLTLRDLSFNPLTPNALALAELKMHGHLIRYDLYGGIPDSYIVDNDLNKPYRNPNPPTNLYIFGTNEMRERAIPFLISDYHTIIVACPKDVGLFRKFFREFECSRAFNDNYANMNMRTLLSITGFSIFNKYDRLMRQTPQWILTYDFLFTGRDYDSSLDSFTSLVVHYMNYLHQETPGVVVGIFSDEDLDNPIITVYDFNVQTDVGPLGKKIADYFNSKIRLFLLLMVPIEDNFKKIKIYFNMHYRLSEEAGITSLFPANTINDISKVFFTIEEYAIWDQIV